MYTYICIGVCKQLFGPEIQELPQILWPERDDDKLKKMVTSSFVDPTIVVDDSTVSDMTTYEKNFTQSCYIQIYDDTKPRSESHMVKLLKVTHDVKLIAVPCLQLPLKNSTHSLGTKMGM